MLSQNPTNVKWKNLNSNKQHKSKDANDQWINGSNFHPK
jgi:hypothetical protein